MGGWSHPSYGVTQSYPTVPYQNPEGGFPSLPFLLFSSSQFLPVQTACRPLLQVLMPKPLPTVQALSPGCTISCSYRCGMASSQPFLDMPFLLV